MKKLISKIRPFKWKMKNLKNKKKLVFQIKKMLLKIIKRTKEK